MLEFKLSMLGMAKKKLSELNDRSTETSQTEI